MDACRARPNATKGLVIRPFAALKVAPDLRSGTMDMDLLLVDDDQALAASLAAGLSDYGHAVTIVADGREALQSAMERKLDAILLERNLPGMDGLAVLGRLREEGLTVPVVMLSALGQASHKIEALEQGADDYLVKPADVGELNARLGALERRRNWRPSDADTLRAGDIVVSPLRRRAWRAGAPVELSRIEFELLAELVRNAGGVLTRAVLYDRVWRYEAEPKANIADMYVRRLRQKLMAGGGDNPIVTVRGWGYMIRP